MRAFELVGRNTVPARNKVALSIARRNIINGVDQLLYHT
jgi:hypothetical protein